MAGPTDGGPAFSRAIEFPAPLENKSSPIIFVKLSPGKSLPGFKLRFLAEKEAGRVVTPTTSTRRCSNPAWEQALCLLFSFFLFASLHFIIFFSLEIRTRKVANKNRKRNEFYRTDFQREDGVSSWQNEKTCLGIKKKKKRKQFISTRITIFVQEFIFWDRASAHSQWSASRSMKRIRNMLFKFWWMSFIWNRPKSQDTGNKEGDEITWRKEKERVPVAVVRRSRLPYTQGRRRLV